MSDWQPQEIVAFWKEAGRERWFAKNDDFDLEFRERFLDWHMAAAGRQLDHWMDLGAEGCLGLLLLLDQFPRNAFRGTAHMFATDGLGVYFAQQGLARGDFEKIEPQLRVFMVLPLEHAEDLALQDEAVSYCESLDEETLRFAHIHHDIIARFGRFPHRNLVLGRVTTDAEQAFLDAGGFQG